MRSAILVLLGAVLFGTTGTAQTFAPAGVAPLSIGAARIGFGGLVLFAIGCWSWWRRRRDGGRLGWPGWPAALAVAAGASAVCLYQGVFFAGTRANGVMVGTVLALGSSPLFCGVFEWVVLRRRVTSRWVAATALAVAGLVALSWTTTGQERVDPVGVVLSLTAGASYGVLAVTTKWLLDHSWRPADAAAATMGLASAIGFVMLATTDTSWLAQPNGMAVTAWLALATIVAAYLLEVTGMTGLSAASATTLNLAEPATATVLGVAILREALTGLRALGLAAVAAGVVIAGWPSRELPRNPQGIPS